MTETAVDDVELVKLRIVRELVRGQVEINKAAGLSHFYLAHAMFLHAVRLLAPFVSEEQAQEVTNKFVGDYLAGMEKAIADGRSSDEPRRPDLKIVGKPANDIGEKS
jgi:hypothetical protein